MKGLLHSKLFKKNLKKWLFMYVGVLLLLTGVVTYSKYMSKFASASEPARVTKFNVAILDATDDNVCSEFEEGSETYTKCGREETSASDEQIDYYFTVDTRELEVLTKLFVTINIDPAFKLVDVQEEKTPGVYESILREYNSDNVVVKYLTKTDNKGVIYNRVYGDTRGLKKYKLSIKYRTESGKVLDKKVFDAISIDYSATQITKGDVSYE